MPVPDKVQFSMNFTKSVKFSFPGKIRVPDEDPSDPVKNAASGKSLILYKILFPLILQFLTKFPYPVKFTYPINSATSGYRKSLKS